MDEPGRLDAHLWRLDAHGEPVQCDLPGWARWMEEAADQRQVALTDVGDARISTIFTGFDYNLFGDGPPVLWETMVFGGPLDREQRRYTSRAGAEAGHLDLVEQVRQARAPRRIKLEEPHG